MKTQNTKHKQRVRNNSFRIMYTRRVILLLCFLCIQIFSANAAVPVNDECSNAILLTSSSSCNSITVSEVGSTNSNIPSACFGGADDDIWFKFVASYSSETITVSASNS